MQFIYQSVTSKCAITAPSCGDRAWNWHTSPFCVPSPLLATQSFSIVGALVLDALSLDGFIVSAFENKVFDKRGS